MPISRQNALRLAPAPGHDSAFVLLPVVLGLALAADPAASSADAASQRRGRGCCRARTRATPASLTCPALSRPRREVWSYGSTQPTYRFLRAPVGVAGTTAYLGLVGGSLELVQADGARVWKRLALGVTQVVDCLDAPGKGGAALVTIGNNGFALVCSCRTARSASARSTCVSPPPARPRRPPRLAR